MIKLINILTEIGDLTNIKSYPYKKINDSTYKFSFQIDNKEIEADIFIYTPASDFSEALEIWEPFSSQDKEYFKNQMGKIEKKYSYNTKFTQFISISYTLNDEENQLLKTNLQNFFPILKTIKNIILEYINKNKPFVIYMAGSNKKYGVEGADPQKNILYDALSKSNLEYKSMRAADLSEYDGSDDGILLVKKDI